MWSLYKSITTTMWRQSFRKFALLFSVFTFLGIALGQSYFPSLILNSASVNINQHCTQFEQRSKHEGISFKMKTTALSLVSGGETRKKRPARTVDLCLQLWSTFHHSPPFSSRLTLGTLGTCHLPHCTVYHSKYQDFIHCPCRTC